MSKKKEFGIGFTDNLVIDTGKRSKRTIGDTDSIDLSNFLLSDTPPDKSGRISLSWKLVPIKLCVIVFTLIIGIRLFHLQVVLGGEYRTQSDDNRLYAKTIHAPRGIIYDRNRTPLVLNTPAFIKIATDSAETISYQEALTFDAKNLLDTSIEVQAVRNYPYKDSVAHVLGYTSEITKEELKESGVKGKYKLGDRIGRAGLEQVYEQYLKGADGASLIEMDAQGGAAREVGVREPIEGKSIELYIDAGLQKKTYEELSAALSKLGLSSGVAIAQNPKNGAILALVSLPSYDNNLFSSKISQSQYDSIMNNANRPLLNRAVGGVYPPGSIYKIITSAAGLLSKKVDASTRIEDTGVIRIDQYEFPNWYWNSSGKTDGVIDLTKAMARSNDIFYYRVGEWVGNEYLAQVSRQFNMGQPTNIDLAGEVPGLVPTNEWKKNTIGEVWYPGDTYHMSIGQGYNLETPIQMSVLSTFVANDGVAYKPQIASKILDSNGRTVKTFEPKVLYGDILAKNQVQLIKEGMRQACATGGTGWPFFDFGLKRFEKVEGATQAAEIKHRIEVGCKTGTAEFGDAQKRTHAWFTVFAPYDNPEIAMTVLIEAGGEGSNVAAPVAKNVLEWWFSQNKGN